MILTFEQLLLNCEEQNEKISKTKKGGTSPEILMAESRNQHLKQAYGMTLEDYNELFLRQNKKCAICGKHQSESTRRFGVDHDHKTGKVRGILCNRCNTALGCFEKYKKEMETYLRGSECTF